MIPKNNISTEELFLEKLGAIDLCKNCGKRIYKKSVLRMLTWVHCDTDHWYCNENRPYMTPSAEPLTKHDKIKTM